MVACARNRIANLSAELDHRLMHLRLDLLLEHDLSTLEDFLDVRPQLARLRVDNRKLFLDAERVGVLLLHPSGRKTSADFADLHRLFQNRARPPRSAKICEICRHTSAEFAQRTLRHGSLEEFAPA